MKENRWSTTQFDRPPMTKPRTLEEIAHGLWVRDEIGALSEEQFLAALREAADAARREEREEHAKIADNMLRACITDDERDVATTIRNQILARGYARSRAEEPKP